MNMQWMSGHAFIISSFPLILIYIEKSNPSFNCALIIIVLVILSIRTICTLFANLKFQLIKMFVLAFFYFIILLFLIPYIVNVIKQCPIKNQEIV